MSAKDRPPSFQWYPGDFAAAMHRLGADDPFELAYRRALDASWEAGAYGVGTPDEWLGWGRVHPEHADRFLAFLAKETQRQEDGTLVQVRMARDRMEQAIRFRQASLGGQVGNSKRWGSDRGVISTRSDTLTPSSSSSFSSSSSRDSKEEDGAAVVQAVPPARSARRKAVPDRSLPPEFVEAKAAESGVPLPVARVLAERVLLEFDTRGYRSARSAFLNWLRREVANPSTQGNGRSPPKDGDRHGDLVRYAGQWRSEEQARHLGWRG